MSTFEYIIVESKGAVGIITLNRPKMLNALSFGVFREIAAAVDDLEADDKIGCILLTGGEKAFAAGADIKEMQPKTFIDMFSSDFIAVGGDRVANCRKPTIAAVSGYALGGGCELAMMCDIIIAADTAKFGQPEITLGTIPGIGGTQRLTRAIGKSKAMDLCLTGRMMDATEAERSGLVSRIVPSDKLMEEALGDGGKNRRDVASSDRDGKERRQPRVRNAVIRGTQCRTRPVSLDLCTGGSIRRHGGLHRQAQTGEQEQVSAPVSPRVVPAKSAIHTPGLRHRRHPSNFAENALLRGWMAGSCAAMTKQRDHLPTRLLTSAAPTKAR